MSQENLRGVCVGKSCGWTSDSARVGCESGDNSCLFAVCLTANVSAFHTAELAEATDHIRKILSKLKPVSGKKLAFLGTQFGVLLAWVEHDKSPGNVTADSDPQDIINALGLTGIHADQEKRY
jgi:hypothetical protein